MRIYIPFPTKHSELFLSLGTLVNATFPAYNPFVQGIGKALYSILSQRGILFFEKEIQLPESMTLDKDDALEYLRACIDVYRPSAPSHLVEQLEKIHQASRDYYSTKWSEAWTFTGQCIERLAHGSPQK